MEYWLELKSKLSLRSNNILLLIILCLFLTGCHSEQKVLEEDVEVAEEAYTVSEEENNIVEENALGETNNNMVEKPQVFYKTGSQKENFADEYPYIDYDYVEQYHEILFHNITVLPKEDYDDTVLVEYLKEDIEKDKKLLEAASGEEIPLTIKYHLFDFNDDGLDDYLVCLEGSFWKQYDDKNTIRIYMQEQNGTLWEAFEGYATFCRPDYQPPVAVLAERAEGFHSLALPGTNSLLRYDKERGQYEFCEMESNAEEAAEDEIHVGMTEEDYAEKKEVYENIKRIDMSVYIDYEFIEAKHKILRHNICMNNPKDANDNTLLKEALQDDMEYSQKMYEAEVFTVPLYVDYFPFDFNDDGLEDYLVCYHGSGWYGTAGNYVAIYVQESNSSLREVFSITMRLYDHVSPYDHSPMAMLDEKDDGYYAFVLVGNNHIIRYNEEKGGYEFENK